MGHLFGVVNSTVFSSCSQEHSSFGCIVHIALHCQILYCIILGLVHILIIIRKLKSVRQRKYGKLVIGSHIVDNSSNHDMFINKGLVIWLVGCLVLPFEEKFSAKWCNRTLSAEVGWSVRQSTAAVNCCSSC